MRTPLTITRVILLLSIILLTAQTGYAQTDSTSLSNRKLFRPQIGFNTGLISYYGDVGKLPDGVSQSPNMNWGYNLSMVTPINEAFDFRAFAFFGKITQEERTLTGNANFSTPISMGGLSVSYNFHHLLPEERTIEPYLSIGVSTFEFNPKADLQDANGNTYHYWSDGTIRNVTENTPDKSSAIILERDYTYESDLRSQNEEGLPYALRGVTMPIGAGANLRINDFFTLNMGTEFHLSFTDNIDNISGESSSIADNDHFMFSSIGLMYNLHHRKKKGTSDYLNESEGLIEFEDEDMDGVADIIDLCPFTEGEVQTDEYGCPLDSDKDGVPDYMDIDPFTEEGVIVNFEGAELLPSEILNIYLTYKDSVGTLSYQKSQTKTADFEGNDIKIRNRSKGYRINIMDSEQLSPEATSKLLSISDVKSHNNGSITYYLGDFETLEKAVMRNMELKSLDLPTQLVFNEFGEQEEVANDKITALETNFKEVESTSNETVFRVQIGAFKHTLSENIFGDAENLLIILGDDGLIRYVSGAFPTIKEAAQHKIDLLLKGFEGAFVTAYKNGERISLKEAGARVSEKTSNNAQTSNASINGSFVKFTIELGSFEGRVPANMLSSFMELDGVRPIRDADGSTSYVYNKFNSLEEAKTAFEKMDSTQFPNARVVGSFNGKIISAEEAVEMKNQ